MRLTLHPSLLSASLPIILATALAFALLQDACATSSKEFKADGVRSPLSVPTDADIFGFHVFQEPLVPVGGKTIPEENAALSDAIRSYKKRIDRDDDSGITNFLKEYPESPWRAALLLNLGLEYRQTGWFLKALAAWEEAWKLSKHTTDGRAKALADRTIGELAELNARVGRRARVDALLKEIEHRPLIGSATEKVTGARESSWLMQHEPGRAFICGSVALNYLHALENPDESLQRTISEAQSSERGMSLTQVKQLARELKMDYVAAKRHPGAKVIVPSMVNWKAEHYAALVKEENGLFLVQDPSLGGEIWVSQAALDAESSGYFLVRRSELPAGWQLASAKETSRVWGRGATTGHDVTGTKVNDAKAKPVGCPTRGMAVYNFHLQTVSLNITDTPVGYVPPVGPAVEFTATYNQREATQPQNFDYSNLGPKWNFNWLSYLKDGNSQSANVTLYPAGGGMELYEFDSVTGGFKAEFQSGANLRRISWNPIVYERTSSDGSRERFAEPDGSTGAGRRVFLSDRIDPAGKAAHLTYDSNLRLLSITDPVNTQPTMLYYELSEDIYKITKVTDPFARSANFAYTNGLLTSITDTIGIISWFTYEDTVNVDFITTLTTPYRTTIFTQPPSSLMSGQVRVLEATDPVSGERERVEFGHEAPGIPGCTPAPCEVDPNAPIVPGYSYLNKYHQYRNSFYWDKKAMALYPPPVNGSPDFTKAKLTQFGHLDATAVSNIKEREKEPLENPVYYFYPGQPGQPGLPGDPGDPGNPVSPYFKGSSGLPSIIAQRLLPDGTSRVVRFQRNALGRVTKATDPVGRVTHYDYAANDIDLVAVHQSNATSINGTDYDPTDLVFSCIYNDSHQPLTMTDAAGQPTVYTYTPVLKQLETVTNARGETTSYEYGDGSEHKPVGYLTKITSPEANLSSTTTNFSYDDATRRVHEITTTPDYYTITVDYDALDRPTQIGYPDHTTEEFGYTDIARGMTLDLTASKDRLDRWTYRHYNSNRQMDTITDPETRTTRYDWCACGSLTSITDPNLNLTTFVRDLQGRLKSKISGDGSPISSTVTFDYEDSTSRLKSMTDALHQTTNYHYTKDDNLEQVSYTDAVKSTPTVNFDYDPYYNRINSMTTEGIGTTTYSYYRVFAPPTLGATRLHTVGGLYPNDTIEYTYDKLGRTEGQSVNGVAQTVVRDALGRVKDKWNALGHFTSIYDGPTPRLDTLSYPNGVSAHYAYFENEQDRRLETLQNGLQGETPMSSFDYTYDSDGQIKNWNSNLDGKNRQRWFDYDFARQLKSVHDAEHLNDSTSALDFDYDFAGNRTGDRAYSPLTYISTGLVHAYTPNALNQIGLVETTQSDGPTIPTWLTWDANGNMTYDGAHLTFEWDAANRLSAVNHTDSGERSEFAYDGLGRRVKITEYGPGVTATVKPKGSEWTTFNTAPFTLPTGSYTLTFEGLISNGDDLAIIDSVTLNSTLVANGNFEDPDVSQSSGGYEYQPSGATWSFTGYTGIASNGGELTSNNADAPDGRQVGFIQGVGKIYQTQSVSAGTHTLSFQAAQGGNNSGQQQVRVTLRPSGAASQVKTFVWCGTQICEERDSTGATVTKRFFAEGEQRIGGSNAGSYYYSRDHLGSIREVTDASGELQARYDYDAYGNSVVVEGKMNVDFGFTGHYFHAPSGLSLTLYRAYNPALGRWISRDPIGEKGGINLYGYVENNPVNFLDPFGLWQFTLGGGYLYGGLITFGYNGGHVNFGGFIGFAEGIFGELDTEDSPCPRGGFNAGVRIHGEAGVRFLKGRKQVGLSGDSGGAFMDNGGPDPTLNWNMGGRPFNFGPKPNAGTFGAGVGAVIGIGATWTFGP